MTIPTFRPLTNPNNDSDRTFEPRLVENQFGDGYQQSYREGINSILEEISPKWTNANYAEGTYIIDFITERKGRPFFYQMNGEGPIRCYRCTKFSYPKKSGRYFNISATFKQMAPQ